MGSFLLDRTQQIKIAKTVSSLETPTVVFPRAVYQALDIS